MHSFEMNSCQTCALEMSKNGRISQYFMFHLSRNHSLSSSWEFIKHKVFRISKEENVLNLQCRTSFRIDNVKPYNGFWERIELIEI